MSIPVPPSLITRFKYKVVLEPRVSPAVAITYFCNHCNIRFENTSKYVDTLTFFPKTWTIGHWPLDDLWLHVCWGRMCDSTQGSLCRSPMTIHQCMWIQWSILQNTSYILHTYYILRTYYVQYRMSDHIVSYWTHFRRDKNYQDSSFAKVAQFCTIKTAFKTTYTKSMVPIFPLSFLNMSIRIGSEEKSCKFMFLKSNQDHKEGVNVLKHNKGVYSTGHVEGKYASHRSEAAETGHY